MTARYRIQRGQRTKTVQEHYPYLRFEPVGWHELSSCSSS